MDKKQRELNAILLTIPSVLAIVFVYMVLFLHMDIPVRLFPQLESSQSLLFYISACVLGAVGSVLLYHIYRASFTGCLLSERREALISRLTCGLLLFVLALVFVFERQEVDALNHHLPWHHTRWRMLAMILVGLLLVKAHPQLVQFFRFWEKIPFQSKLVVGYYLLIALLAAYAYYLPAVFESTYAGHHFNAYFHSVYRVLQFEPYSDINGGIYGFYGILLAPLVALFGGSYQACMLVLCILSAVCVLCYCYVLHYYVKPLWLRLLCSTSLLAGWTGLSGIYVQHYPHRILFCAISMVLLVTFRKKTISVRCQEGLTLLVSALAILWNTESGISCIFAFFIYHSMRQLRQSRTPGQMVSVLCRQGMLAGLSVLLAVVIANIYCIASGGELLNLNGLLYPYVQNVVDRLNIPLLRLPAVWMLVLGAILIAVCYGTYNTPLCRKDIPESNAPEYVACAAMMAVQMTYYINRAVYGNLYIVFPHMVLLLAIAYVELDAFHHGDYRPGRILARDLRGVIAMVLVLLTFMVGIKYGGAQEKAAPRRDMSGYDTFCQEFTSVVPRDTLCIGIGADELYSSLGWDTGYYGVDLPDISFVTQKGMDELRSLMLEADELVTVSVLGNSDEEWFRQWGIWESFMEEHQQVRTFTFQNTQFVYYTTVQ